jgi:abhydrolase domain-containing protein 6
MIYPTCILASTVAASLFVWYKKPGFLIKYLMKFALYQAGLRKRYVTVGKYRYCYAERGRHNKEKSTILLVHGFSASKDMFVPIVKKLPKDLHIILVDLPGHGDTTVPGPDDDISVIEITRCLHDFTTATGINDHPFHLVGTSLGGAIAALYASTYPQNLERITLICPAMKTPIETEFMKEVEAGHCRLIPNNVDEMRHMMESCMYTKVKLHKQIILGFLQLRLPKNEFFRKLFEEISGSKETQEEMLNNLTKIKIPTQIVWGKQDQLIHVSGVEVLQSRVSPAALQRVDVFDECGHSCYIDQPDLLIKSILLFREDDYTEITNKLN